ncbi:ninja-family protein AFP3-like isoform X2 [Salvia splendens]|uniref:ninja-family protein AFP3-like isoform X2 n=1 Tax=Salvia splendens TaxID=180675 RepID=UPI001C273751|nr:ninja-family protein AFP3-like isoform X2 [Salvia splendens]
MEGGKEHRDAARRLVGAEGSSRDLVPKLVRRGGAATGNAGNGGPEPVRTCSLPPEFGRPRMDTLKSVAGGTGQQVHAAANGALKPNDAGSRELPKPPPVESKGNLVNGANQANTTGGSCATGQPSALIVNTDEALVKSGMVDMPYVSMKGYGPNHSKTEGFLYRYKRGEEVKIVCVCHGLFLTPAEFVRHGGGGDVAFPLKHIVVTPFSLC